MSSGLGTLAMASTDTIQSLLEEKGVGFLLCSFVEMSGVPKAKLIPATHLLDMISSGAGFAGFAAGNLGQGPHDADIVSIPDPNSLAIVPWKKTVAWTAGNLFVEGKPWPFCPRTILTRQLERARHLGYRLNVGAEPEFMLLKRGPEGACAPWDELDNSSKPCYDLRALYRNLNLMTTLVGYLQELGWEPYAADHEDANCQFEINWAYADALTTSDRHVFFRWMVKTVAEEAGLWATFMPKPFSYLTGNGSHFHLSLADTVSDRNLFLSRDRDLGLSPLALQFMAGLLHHAPALCAVLAPLVNSYKRLVRGSPRSGATWAPVYVTWGPGNRTQMIRIPAPGRLEVRIADAAANPYLASAVMLAAGLDGIEKGMDPGVPNGDNLYEVPERELRARKIRFLPATLKEAIDALAEDEVVSNALGAEYAKYYIKVKTEEWDAYHQTVSQWETDRYLNTH